MNPCTVLKDFVFEGHPGLHYSTGNIFNDENAFMGNLRVTGFEPRLTCSDGLLAFVYRNGADHFILFFNFDRDGEFRKTVRAGHVKLDLTVGSKTCGVVRVSDGRIKSYLVKGVNEFEKISSKVRISMGDQSFEFTGDQSRYDI